MAAPAVQRVPELDLLRGWAALLMVFNHVGYALLAPHAAGHGVTGALVWLGSCAPALFFFATGFGTALAPRPLAWPALLDKALLLLVADQFLAWSVGRPVALDFFGFIAVSLIAARAVLATSAPVRVALLAALALLVLRFLVGKPLDARLEGYGLLRWAIGVTPHDAVSYPGAPWLVFPLLGVALGVLHRRRAGRVPVSVGVTLIAGTLVGAATAAWLASHGRSMHRWGSVGVAFVPAALAVLLASLALSGALVRALPRAAALLSLGSIASFAVVPLHYAVVRGGLLPTQQTSLWRYLALSVLLVAASFALARGFERAALALANAPRRDAALGLALLLAVAGAVAAIAAGRSGCPACAQAGATLGQLALGMMFAWRVGLFGARHNR